MDAVPRLWSMAHSPRSNPAARLLARLLLGAQRALRTLASIDYTSITTL